ncbi:serine/threonine-protein kinase [Kribbella aluminosa]|uniref:non-specific serine/threonine protein kinase n=1 Tax=Kribbella aluminosa TaxID=416017 RepID=A0ABS4UGN4_9ACTN|nr:serine/threonine-protein kinase [Kribbella aluminosa]MBP2350726.1 serine/threonine-protein kinase [Kribbella aluminosa]
MEAFAGRFQLIDLIGTGGMGSVWRAWDLRRSTYVAAKVLGQHDAATLLRFVREQSLRIEHRHVIAPHGWAADDDKVVFAMDLVRGGSVATLLGDHGPLPTAYVAIMLDQLLHGLSAVHAARVVHRDVKPANLLLDVTGTGRPHLRLSDFGVAGLLDEPRMTHRSMILGTPGYLAPEQLTGADPDPRQDLYAVGAVAAELLTGERPAPDGNPREPVGPLSDFIRHLTAPDPSDRPTSAAAAAQLLATATANEPTSWANGPDTPEVFEQLPPLPSPWTPTGPQPPATPSPGPTNTPTTHQTRTNSPALPSPPAPTGQPGPGAPFAAGAEAGAGAAGAGVRASPGRVPGAGVGEAAAGVAGAGIGVGAAGVGAGGGGRDVGRGELVGGGVSQGRGSWAWWVAGVCWVGAVGLLGSAIWLLIR